MADGGGGRGTGGQEGLPLTRTMFLFPPLAHHLLPSFGKVHLPDKAYICFCCKPHFLIFYGLIILKPYTKLLDIQCETIKYIEGVALVFFVGLIISFKFLCFK